jgi:hypothetical protein
MKNRRKKRLIDLSFQLKTALPALVVCLASFSIIIGFVLFITGMPGSGGMAATDRELEWAVGNQDNIVSSFKEYAKRVKDPIFILATDKIEEDHRKNIAVIKESIGVLRAYNERSNQLLVLAVVVMAVNAALIFFIIIRMTHRAAGPARVMSRQARALLEGRHMDERPLRKNDELRDFYEEFQRIAERFRRKRVAVAGSGTKGKKRPTSGEKSQDASVASIRVLKNDS